MATRITEAMAGLGHLNNLELDCVRQLIARQLEKQEIPFPFLDLPAELRNHIYGLIASENARRNLLMVSDLALARASTLDRAKVHSALNVVSKQVRIEYQDLFYSDKTVQLWTSEKDAQKAISAKWTKLNAPRLMRALLECKVKALEKRCPIWDLDYVNHIIDGYRKYAQGLRLAEVVVVECIGESADRFGFVMLEPGEMQKYVDSAHEMK